MFQLNSSLTHRDTSGTCLASHVYVSPAQVVKVFGKGKESDGHKVSSEWTFQMLEKPSVVFTLYDWKCTDMYYESGPSPEKFWADENPKQLNIGTHPNTIHTHDFVDWLEAALETGETRICPVRNDGMNVYNMIDAAFQDLFVVEHRARKMHKNFKLDWQRKQQKELAYHGGNLVECISLFREAVAELLNSDAYQDVHKSLSNVEELLY